MEITFFGVRGSCPCAGDSHRRYGGSTSCVLVRIADSEPLILDLGTGLRVLGASGVLANRSGGPNRLTALLTHLHLDHVVGLPFFDSLNDPGTVLEVHGPKQPDGSFADALPRIVQPPFFPVDLDSRPAKVVLHDLENEDFGIGSAKVRARYVPHLGPTLGYRIDANGLSMAYIPDHQVPEDRESIADNVLELCDGVDLLIHDAQYTTDELEMKSDWGHSTAEYAVTVALAARARALMLFHHDPSHSDADIDSQLKRAHAVAGGRISVSAASEGQSVVLRGN